MLLQTQTFLPITHPMDLDEFSVGTNYSTTKSSPTYISSLLEKLTGRMIINQCKILNGE